MKKIIFLDVTIQKKSKKNTKSEDLKYNFNVESAKKWDQVQASDFNKKNKKKNLKISINNSSIQYFFHNT